MKELKSKFIKLHKQGLSYREIGLKYSITKQRVHQVIKDYTQYSGNQLKIWREKHVKTNRCPVCLLKKKLTLHHLDKNRRNHNPDNFLFLCFQCHKQIHSNE